MSNLFFQSLDLLLTCLLLVLIILFPILVTWDNVLFLSLAILSICIYKIMKNKKHQASNTKSSLSKKSCKSGNRYFLENCRFCFHLCSVYFSLWNARIYVLQPAILASTNCFNIKRMHFLHTWQVEIPFLWCIILLCDWN